ncbi:hypothetical protein G6L28_22495 [Agrobacterium larrymoorei]|uniref:hypothetical protein n=1 Tax=Agrobacterium larrymoorei TaxID=160699 RepID=UPI001574C66B|nr:hypothetical protein [Agrobacterium larrymoorei]NTJ45339.1 hypothetical protein [Agrobacterium larrymoorei]
MAQDGHAGERLDIREVIIHRIPVSDFRTEFDNIASGSSGKIVLGWTKDDDHY